MDLVLLLQYWLTAPSSSQWQDQSANSVSSQPAFEVLQEGTATLVFLYEHLETKLKVEDSTLWYLPKRYYKAHWLGVANPGPREPLSCMF